MLEAAKTVCEQHTCHALVLRATFSVKRRPTGLRVKQDSLVSSCHMRYAHDLTLGFLQKPQPLPADCKSCGCPRSGTGRSLRRALSRACTAGEWTWTRFVSSQVRHLQHAQRQVVTEMQGKIQARLVSLCSP